MYAVTLGLEIVTGSMTLAQASALAAKWNAEYVRMGAAAEFAVASL